MENIALKDMTLSFLDDLTVQAAISDCGEMVRLNSEMIYARNHGADEATIESFTSQMNQLMTATMSVKSLDMLLPLKLKTALMGVDYNSVSAVKFNDENAFVPIVDLLDQQALRYWTNIKEHSAAPLQESMEILMQMIYIMNIFTGDVFDLDNYGNMDSVSQ